MEDIFGWITSLMTVLDFSWAMHIMMGGFFLPPIWVLMGSNWSLGRLHFKIPWSAEIWFGMMVALMGGVPRWRVEGDIHNWLSGSWARSWWATWKFMIPGSRRLGCAGYSWRSLAITWHTLSPRVWGWRRCGRMLASWSSKEYGYIVMMQHSYHKLCLHHTSYMMRAWGSSKSICCWGDSLESKGRFALIHYMMLQE